MAHQLCFRAVLGTIEEEIVARSRARVRVYGMARRRLAITAWQQTSFWAVPKELVRPKSHFNRKQLTRAEIAFGKATMKDPYVARPKTRAECLGHQGPCPWAACRFHLSIEINPIGSLKVTFPGFDMDELPETCSLNVADKGPQTIEMVSTLMNLSEEWIRQIEASAVRKMRRGLGDQGARRVLRVVVDEEGRSQDGQETP